MPLTKPELPIPNHFNLPQRIRRLSDLAYNLWWTWKPEAGRLFQNIDSECWESTYHNPVEFLRCVDHEQLTEATQRQYYLDAYDQVIKSFDAYMHNTEDTWFAQTFPDRSNQPIAYFSTEFGLHETLPIYAGGLGVLSGDHLKEASDLGIPLVAIGFLYTQGYFKQRISEDGWQIEDYAQLSFNDLPVYPVLNADDEAQSVSVQLPGRSVHARLWRVQVGRVPLFLLDSNVEKNQPADRGLTARLYTSDLELRISQEIILGIGGVRALRTLGYNPAVWHLNEGHSAFQTLERARELTTGGMNFDEACERVRSSTVFTTHTPVAAGHDEFQLWMMDKYFSNYWPQLGLEREAFINLALEKQPWGDTFGMATLAMRMSTHLNGVSELHGQVARHMWAHLWPEKDPQDVPIRHITNGIHSPTWLARRLNELYSQYMQPDWLEHIDDPEMWEAIDQIPDQTLWALRRHLKRKLVAYMRDRVRAQWIPGAIHPVQVVASGVLLDPYALTIGFARRFATYKRASLILHDPERLLSMINQSGRPVQFIFAGKAHPADEPGKKLIQEVYRFVKKAETGGRLVFLEDYDMNLARYMVQGVDVWLNTPRRPNEASGTSGQKAALNGVLNCSVLDGWWREGFNGTNGWAIGDEQEYPDEAAQDQADVESLYKILEEEIVPLFYDRSADNLPSEWLGRVRNSIKTLAPMFSMKRMVKQYMNEMYLPALPEPSKR
jgi:starch phosphorylase